jgi:hypothetical protein
MASPQGISINAAAHRRHGHGLLVGRQVIEVLSLGRVDLVTSLWRGVRGRWLANDMEMVAAGRVLHRLPPGYLWRLLCSPAPRCDSLTVNQFRPALNGLVVCSTRLVFYCEEAFAGILNFNFD